MLAALHRRTAAPPHGLRTCILHKPHYAYAIAAKRVGSVIDLPSRIKNRVIPCFLALNTPHYTTPQHHSTMHEVFHLPEIVATILENGKSTEGLLFTSLFLNKLFFQEASRILWYGCGNEWNSAIAGHVTPDICHLARIVVQDVNRAQIYANIIHVLQFRDDGEEYKIAEEARWHHELSQLQFPALEQVDLYASEEAITMNTGEVVLHYAQPNIKRMALHAGSQLNDSFLDTLCKRCPKLREIILESIKDNTVTQEGLTKLIRSTPELRHFQIGDEFEQVWTQQVFEAISTYQNLVLLHVHYTVDDSWITALDYKTTHSTFPKLRHLCARVPTRALELLHGFIPELSTLRLKNEELGPSHQILVAASRFRALTELKIHFGNDNSISGQELVQLAQNCPSLRDLCIGEEYPGACTPGASGINDELMETFAKNAPNLRDLHLVFHPRFPVASPIPTFQSLRSLGRHCPALVFLTLTCDVDWDEVRRCSSGMMFPELWSLKLFGLHGLEHNDEDVIKEIAKRLVSLAPSIMHLSFHEPTDVEDLLADAVTFICYGIGDVSSEDEGVNEGSEEVDREG
jgi:hypothetical protein